MWFSYDPEDGFETHDTEADAIQRVELCLESYRDVAENDGDWPLDIHQVHWGKVHGELRERIIDSHTSDFVIEALKDSE